MKEKHISPIKNIETCLVENKFFFIQYNLAANQDPCKYGYVGCYARYK